VRVPYEVLALVTGLEGATLLLWQQLSTMQVVLQQSPPMAVAGKAQAQTQPTASPGTAATVSGSTASKV